jgi:hypothetical protein
VTPSRLRALSLLALLVLGGAALLAWSQPWFVLELPEGPLAATGETAAPALAALALSELLVVPALAIAGAFFRVVLAVLQSALGACVVLQASVAIADPVQASARAVSEITGIEGASGVAGLVASASSSAWPAVALVAGVLMVLAGPAIAVTSRRWPAATRKYRAVRFAAADDAAAQPGRRGEARRGAIDDWDALSGGADPTDAADSPDPAARDGR